MNRLCLTLALLTGCGAGAPATKVRPKQLKVADAMGQATEQACLAGDEAEPLVIDLPARHRADLEVVMSEGIAAVRYDCKSMKLLKTCKAEGSYAYQGVLLKEEVLRLENADEIKANLPLTGAGVAAKIGAEMARGATLDLAMAMVGQKRAARYELARDELTGRCKGATHFVQSAHVGAFVMQQGEKADLASAARMFGVGASAGASSHRMSRQADGNLDACRRSAPGAAQPEAGCGAILRLYLLPIDPAGTAPSAPSRIARRPSCPSGMTYIAGKCTRAGGPKCSIKTPTACKSLCDAGDGSACGLLGGALRYGKGIAKDRAAAARVHTQGCKLGDATSCRRLSAQFARGKGVTADPSKALSLADRACNLGDGEACFSVGLAYSNGKGVGVDLKRGFAAYTQGCSAGYPRACTNLGKAYSTGAGVAPDVVKSFHLYLRACEGGSATACYNVGVRASKGKGTAKDPARAKRYYKRACRLGKKKACR